MEATNAQPGLHIPFVYMYFKILLNIEIFLRILELSKSQAHWLVLLVIVTLITGATTPVIGIMIGEML